MRAACWGKLEVDQQRAKPMLRSTGANASSFLDFARRSDRASQDFTLALLATNWKRDVTCNVGCEEFAPAISMQVPARLRISSANNFPDASALRKGKWLRHGTGATFASRSGQRYR